ncbi:sperm microtubule inner protein 6 isoform 2-T3 [Ara ararauna]
MFLFSKKHKTPVSTYTDSYRPPYSVKKALCDRGLLETWKENKFVTQETRTNSLLYSIPVVYPLRPTCLNHYEKVVVADMMHRVPVYTVTGRIPFQSYYIPCSGRHCCLRGIDCYLDGTPATRKKLFAAEERADHPMPPSKAQSDVLCLCSLPPAVLAVQDT